jgi:hypothetical protein
MQSLTFIFWMSQPNNSISSNSWLLGLDLGKLHFAYRSLRWGTARGKTRGGGRGALNAGRLGEIDGKSFEFQFLILGLDLGQ